MWLSKYIKNCIVLQKHFCITAKHHQVLCVVHLLHEYTLVCFYASPYNIVLCEPLCLQCLSWVPSVVGLWSKSHLVFFLYLVFLHSRLLTSLWQLLWTTSTISLVIGLSLGHTIWMNLWGYGLSMTLMQSKLLIGWLWSHVYIGAADEQ